MASTQGHRNRSVQQRPGSAAKRAPRRARAGARTNGGSDSPLELVQERVGEWVSERPWAMVGAAAGVGVALGAATRTRASQELGRMVAATASGIAVRYALDTLAQFLEPNPEPDTDTETEMDGNESRA